MTMSSEKIPINTQHTLKWNSAHSILTAVLRTKQKNRNTKYKFSKTFAALYTFRHLSEGKMDLKKIL
jgi:hypothetical protein